MREILRVERAGHEVITSTPIGQSGLYLTVSDFGKALIHQYDRWVRPIASHGSTHNYSSSHCHIFDPQKAYWHLGMQLGDRFLPYLSAHTTFRHKTL